MYFDYVREVFKFEVFKTEKYFFTYKIVGDEFQVMDVYVKPEYRKTKHVKELYDTLEKTWLESPARDIRSMVQRGDANFKNALSMNLRYGMKIEREDQNGKIFLRRSK